MVPLQTEGTSSHYPQSRDENTGTTETAILYHYSMYIQPLLSMCCRPLHFMHENIIHEKLQKISMTGCRSLPAVHWPAHWVSCCLPTVSGTVGTGPLPFPASFQHTPQLAPVPHTYSAVPQVNTDILHTTDFTVRTLWKERRAGWAILDLKWTNYTIYI